MLVYNKHQIYLPLGVRILIGLLTLVCIMAGQLNAQSETAYWYFGNGAALHFQNDCPFALTGGQTEAIEGVSSISSADGALLFYTNGLEVWNAEHELMDNGTGLNGHWDAMQNSLIVPQTYNSGAYYLFTIYQGTGKHGLQYSEVDMSLDAGLGNVTIKNIPLLTPVAEKMTAVPHSNAKDFWVICRLMNTNEFHAFIATSDEVISTPTISSIGSIDSGITLNPGGMLKASVAGNRLAASYSNSETVEVYDFNASTGIISNVISITAPELEKCYGVEFSPDASKLYVTVGYWNNRIYQLDLSSGNAATINASLTLIDSTSSIQAAGIQIAVDGKIYITEPHERSLAVIECPNELGSNCNFKPNAVDLLSGISKLGLPNFPAFYFDTEPDYIIQARDTCTDSNTLFSLTSCNADSIHWNFGDPKSGTANFSNQLSAFHSYTKGGDYTISAIMYRNCETREFTEQIWIYETPEVRIIADEDVCDGFEIMITANVDFADSYRWGDGSSEPTLMIDKPGVYYLEAENSTCGVVRDSITIEAPVCDCTLLIPNAFTPNDDGINDDFKPITDCSLESYQMEVYNRWGQQIFTTNDPAIGWDGIFRNESSALGVYVYVIKYEYFSAFETQTLMRSGNVSLIR